MRYVTFVGRSGWAVVNSFWAALFHTDFRPKDIHVIYKKHDSEVAEKSIEGLKTILEVEDIDAEVNEYVIEDEFDVMKAAEHVEDICDERYPVILDITPARKAMASGSVIEGVKMEVEGVFYLYIDSVDNADRPYLDIPLPRQDLVEMIGGDHLVEGRT